MTKKTKAMNALVVGGGGTLKLYEKMQTAISKCYNIDEYKCVADNAAGIAEYFKQMKDDESVKKFLAIKLRAWRRIGEIFATVDKSDCESVSAHIRKIQKAFASDPIVPQLSDSAFRQALRLAELPVDFFEQELGKHPSINSIVSAYLCFSKAQWEASPEGQEELKRQKAERARHEKEQAKQDVENEKIATQEERAAEKARKEDAKIDEAFGEVGVTLDRHDREDMKQVVFLIKKSIHETLRQAAFDQRTTMQAILRSGLAMWFYAHGYVSDMGDFNQAKPNFKTTNGEKSRR
jgi:hypothetical protein